MTKVNPMQCPSRICTILAFILLAWSLPAIAAPPDSAKVRAQATLREGNVALEQGRAEEALAKFTDAYRLFPSPKIHYNIGQAHSLIPGHEAQAYEAMLRFLIEAKDAEANLRAAAEALRMQLKPKVGMLSVVAEPADADLLIDDVNVGKTSREAVTVLGIGTHRLALTKDAAVSTAQTIRIAGGDAQEVRLQLFPQPQSLAMLPLPTAPANAPAALPGTNVLQAAAPTGSRGYWTWQHEVGAGLAVLGVASLVFGVAEHISYFGKANDFKNAGCGTNDLSVGSGCKSLNDQFKSAQTLFIVGYIGAAVLGGTGTYLLWLTPAEAPTGAGGGVASTNFGNSGNAGLIANFRGRF
jgi:tetratricopeptide (TPR) repeat protein